MTPLRTQIAAARRVATPLIGISTADPAGTLREVAAALKPDQALLVWDTICGLHSGDTTKDRVNLLALLALAQSAGCSDQNDLAQLTQNPVAMLELLPALESYASVVMYGANRIIDKAEVIQAIWNLRDQYKDGRTLVLVGPHLQLPTELCQDVMLYDDPLPADEEIERIVIEIYKSGCVAVPSRDILDRCVTALRGLSAFAAEQCAATALTSSGMDIEQLWDRKRKAVEQTPGLRFSYGGQGFDSIGGLSSLKQLGRGLFANADKRPGVVVFIDELEKWASGIMGASGDNGVDKDAFSVVLREIAEHEYPGITLVGPPGTGKTIYAKALAAEHNVPLLEVDLGEAKGSLMGESQAKIRGVFRTIHALAGKNGAIIVAAANSLPDDIPQELMRRVAELGIYFVDLPTSDERMTIWNIQMRRFRLETFANAEIVDDRNWTGAEIRACCNIASRLNCDIPTAAERVIPISRSNPEAINKLRRQASGRWQSANELGPYITPTTNLVTPPNSERKIDFEGAK